jgi:hypothetical protein
MSIKTIDRSAVSDKKGLEKKINKSAEKMVFDILQASQYSTPIPSTVRELVTNACDSQREKEIAIEILKGERQIEDYYINRQEEEYRDSNFNLSYYDLGYLNQEKSHVDIIYTYGEGLGYCDTFEVIDYGVGVGGDRLRGILELGYSTKRNTSENFGAFGLGAKVALSTNVPFYTIHTKHNGREYLMNCLPYKTNFMINKFEAAGSIDIDGETVYYKSTEDCNTTKISFGVKKHNRQRFLDTIEEQLMYLDNVRLTIRYDTGNEFEKDFKADVLHNSDSIIVSDKGYWSKPHIVIVKSPKSETGINYGYIDFRELEMEQLYGSVGLKCPIRQSYKSESGEEIVIQDGVDVTPSREKVIWNENTKQFVQGVIEKAAEEASTMVEEQLKETDFLKWIIRCRDVLVSSNTYGSALYHISKIIDTEKLNPKFSKNSKIHYKNPKAMLPGYTVKKVYSTVQDKKYTIVSDEVNNWGDVDFDKLYYREAGRSKVKDFYLLSENSVFYTIKKKNIKSLQEKLDEAHPDDKGVYQARINKVKASWGIDEEIKNSSLFNSYDEIEVPEEYESKLRETEKEVGEANMFNDLSPAERRKIEERIVAFSLRYKNSQSEHYLREAFVWDKVEPKLKTLMTSETVTYYCTNADRDLLLLAASLTRKMTPTGPDVYKRGWYSTEYHKYHGGIYPMFYRDEIPSNRSLKGLDLTEVVPNRYTELPQFIKLSESNLRYVELNDNCKHISEFFLQLTESGGYTMDSSLIRWCTAHQIGDLPEWIDKLGVIDERFRNLYQALYAYKKDYFYMDTSAPVSPSEELFGVVKRMMEFKNYEKSIQDCDNKDTLLSEKSRELFTLDIPEVKCFDNDVMELIDIKNDIIEDINAFMRSIQFPVVKSPEFLQELRSYLKQSGKLDIQFPETLTSTQTQTT